MTSAADTHTPPGPWQVSEKPAIRRRLVAYRTSMPDREERMHRLLAEIGRWLTGRTESVIGAYWPIRGEPDLLPFLGSWLGGAAGRAVGLPVIDPDSSRLVYRGWHPGVRMQDDAFGIPTPEGTPVIAPQVLLVPCVGFGPGGIRLGYGGGFFDRTLSAAGPQPLTAGVAFARTFVADLPREDHDVPLDFILTEDGVAWGQSR